VAYVLAPYQHSFNETEENFENPSGAQIRRREVDLTVLYKAE